MGGTWFTGLFTATEAFLFVFVAMESALLALSFVLGRTGGRLPGVFRDILRMCVYVGTCVVLLRAVFGVGDLASLLGASAVLSIVIGLAIQEPLGTIFAGLFLQIDEPLQVGDWVDVAGVEGKVIEINWRSTRILTRSNDFVSIPNSLVAKGAIVNFSAPSSIHRVVKKLNVGYGGQPNKVKKVLVEMMHEIPGVLRSPAPEVLVEDYGASTIEYELRYWVKDVADERRISDEVLTGIWYQFRRHEVDVPFASRDAASPRAKREGAARAAENLELLRRVDFLASLSDADLALLAEDLTSEIYAKGERVFVQGSRGDTLCILSGGKVGVLARDEDGEEVEVAELKRGDYFGEMSLLTGEERSATVVAKEDVELLELSRGSFSVLLKSNPAIAGAIAEVVAKRQTLTKAKLESVPRAANRVLKERADEVRSRAKGILDGIKDMFRFRET